VNSVADQRSARSLYEVFLERVIRIDAVQRHRAAAVTDNEYTAQFFDAGRRPGPFGDFKWSLDAPAAGDWGPLAPSTGEKPAPVSPAMQQAWDAAVTAWRKFIAELANGEMIVNGMHPVSGIRTELDPFEWSRTELELDVRNGDLIEGWYGRPYGKHTVRWSAIVLQPAEPMSAAIPEQKLGQIDWDDWWNHELARWQQGLLPNKKAYLLEAEPRIMERYGLNTVPPSELRRIKAALYRGDSERPKRPKRKQPKLKG
jgi:hypothetical protein